MGQSGQTCPHCFGAYGAPLITQNGKVCPLCLGIVSKPHVLRAQPTDQRELKEPQTRRRSRPSLSIDKLWVRDEGWCRICGHPVERDSKHRWWKPTRDHKLPVELGGTNAPSNLQLAHSLCNIWRGTSRRIGPGVPASVRYGSR